MPTETPNNLETRVVRLVYDAQERARSKVQLSPEQIRMINEEDAKDLAALRQMLNQ